MYLSKTALQQTLLIHTGSGSDPGPGGCHEN